MKTVPPSSLSSSSMKSTTTSAATDEDRSEFRDSCYYPGCRKDANCNCEICLASINATLDLIQKSSLSKFSASRGPTGVQRTPISFNSSILSTPISTSPRKPMSPSLRSSGKSTLNLNLKNETRTEKTRERSGPRSLFYWLALVLSLAFMAEHGFSRSVSGFVKPALSHEAVRNLGEKSRVWRDLNGKLRLIQRELQGLVDGEVSNCSYANSVWKISQDNLLLRSHCTLYKSAMEEVSIWGWPLQTAGLLKSGSSSASFTVISGRLTEWLDGKIGYVTRKANTSWELQKWATSAVQLDRNTWILEYQRSSMLDNPRLVSATLAFFKYKMERMVGNMKQKFWVFPAFGYNKRCHSTGKCDTKVPT